MFYEQQKTSLAILFTELLRHSGLGVSLSSGYCLP